MDYSMASSDKKLKMQFINKSQVGLRKSTTNIDHMRSSFQSNSALSKKINFKNILSSKQSTG